MLHRIISFSLAAAAMSIGLATLTPQHGQASSTLDRDADPVVLTGAALPSLVGKQPGRIVAFKFTGTWQQVPVQVDERRTQSFGTIYNTSAGAFGGFSTLVYADAGTYAGADPNAAFDADDELVFMARDAGGPTGATAEPPGTLAGSGCNLP